MFTDMVGSTASAQVNEAAALQLRDEQAALVRPLFAAHQGREIKSMGDGFLAEFDSALRAVQCAIGIQQRLHDRNSQPGVPPIRLRIGIHLGDVEQREADIFGDSVNIASRIEQVAEPGGICVSGAVHEQVQNKVSDRLERLPPTALKGVRATMEIYRVVLPWMMTASPPGDSGPTGIAVLPFTNISPDPNDEYFADGLTEELITVLSQLRELRVISRTSVMLYKASPKSTTQIGAELGVVSILEGSVRKAGHRLRVTAQLIDARSDRHLWATTYDRELDDVFAVQAEIARQVADGLKVELRPGEAARLDLNPGVRSDSYSAYLKGRTLLYQQNEISYRAAKEQFDRAIALDPRNAAAHSGLADLVLLHGPSSFGMSRTEADGAGRRLADRAIELDPNLAEAHASVGGALWRNYDFTGAEREFQRALLLNPSYSQAHHWYAELLSWELRTDEALAEWALAEASDPLSPFNLSHHALLLGWLGKYDQALARIQKLGELQPESWEYHHGLCNFHRFRSELDRYLQELSWLEASVSDPARKREIRADYYAFSGEGEKCRAIVREEESRPEPGFGAFSFAWLYAALGDVDDCFRWMDRAFEARAIMFHTLRFDPVFERIRADPRYRAVLTKANLA